MAVYVLCNLLGRVEITSNNNKKVAKKIKYLDNGRVERARRGKKEIIIMRTEIRIREYMTSVELVDHVIHTHIKPSNQLIGWQSFVFLLCVIYGL